MLKKIYNSFEGYLRLKVEGDNLEKFINLVMRDGIKLWNVFRISDTFYVNIKLKDFKRIKVYAKSTGVKVRIKERKGVPFFRKKLIGRRFLLVGIILMIVFLHILSSFIFFIEVKGNEDVSKEEIIELLNKAEIRPMVLKSSIPIEELEKAIIHNIPQLAWVDLSYKGTKLIVKVAEKEIIEIESGPSDIVANKAGIISELIVLKGTPMVSEGMTVNEGDVLISREVTLKSDKEEVEEVNKEEVDDYSGLVTKEVKAEGIARARLWYKGYGEAKLREEYRQLTGNYKSSISIKFRDKEFHLKGPKEVPYGDFKVKKQVKTFGEGRNITLPLEVIRRRYIQVKTLEEERDLDIAKTIAKEEAVESILQGLSKEAIILNSKLELIENKDEGLIRVKALLEVEEDISIRRE
ncbi:sporulation protein YqfD [Halonatronum saccharophilum]|uniref:sporulation protein YqfD n=1 Tax=Halonatronum saccharophilum TaxID=150060 RepID=UPI000484FF2C|nr:sporulation protein YqfD [Halonatronum saccharophilum]